MLFNSFEFFIFLPIVFIIYWSLSKLELRIQNSFLLIVSYVFYGWWDYRFLVLILFSTVVDYSIGIAINKSNSLKIKKLFLSISLFANLGTLFFFKYYNFFIESFSMIIGATSSTFDTLNIILPVGISFYTFQTLAYSIDIYRGKLQPTQNFISFAAFVAFFPQLVAGPIEKAQNLLPQLLRRRVLDKQNLFAGLKLILWGLFKKVAVADSLAPIVNNIFGHYETVDGGALWIGAIFFAFQVYGDFSGYSDIAIGTAKLFGFELMSNFRFPFFSRNFREFWSRWHASLNQWFSDYLLTPLRSRNKKEFVRNTFFVFLASGLWHGANWTFITWGFIMWLLFLPSLYDKNRVRINKVMIISELPKMLLTFLLFSWAIIAFRSETFMDYIKYNVRLFSSIPEIEILDKKSSFYIILLLVIEWTQRKDERRPLDFKNQYLNIWIVMLIFFLTFINLGSVPQQFIYFSF